jgi:hypothetical protein
MVGVGEFVSISLLSELSEPYEAIIAIPRGKVGDLSASSLNLENASLRKDENIKRKYVIFLDLLLGWRAIVI